MTPHIEEIPHILAAGYDRQSDARASGSVASPITQRTANYDCAHRLKAEAEAKGGHFKWIGHYSERPGTSAFGKDERPEFDRLLADCRAGKVNTVIVMYVSRFSRLDPMEAFAIVSELFALGVTIISTTEGTFRRGNIMDIFHILMRLDASHKESANKSVAVRTAHTLARTLGGFVGKTPFGFKLVARTVTYMENGKPRPVVIQVLQHNDDEFEETGWSEMAIVMHIWRTVRENKDKLYDPKTDKFHPGSINHICDWLDVENVPTRGRMVGKLKADSKWDVSTVRRILMDPLIAGMDRIPIYGKKKDGTPGKKVIGYEIKRDPETMEPVELECGPMVPRNEWYEVQAWLGERGRGKGLYNGESLLTQMDILWCSCDWYMVSSGNSDGADYRKPPYRCKRKKSQRTAPNHLGDNTIGKERLDEYVARRLFALMATAEGDEEIADVMDEATKRFAATQQAPEIGEERKALIRTKDATTRALNALYDQFDKIVEEGGFPNEIAEQRYKQTEKTLSDRLSATNAALSALDVAAAPALPIEQWTAAYDEEGAPLAEPLPGADPIGKHSWWGRASMAERRHLVKLFVHRVTVGPNFGKGSAITPPEERVTIQWVHTQKYRKAMAEAVA
ncbi:integrase [Streptomyces phage Shady]|uniref:Integrase n=1 Tax=Streptomyces phage Shady TaxID=2767585 RepID=A0A873WEI0_9CAUD|nr:integrase [Streptomyces phage Shady]